MIFSNRRRLVTVSALAVGLVCGSAGTALFARQAKSGERVDIVFNTVKAEKKQQFEDFLAKFGATLEKAKEKNAETKKAVEQTRILYPAKANEDGTFTYVFLMDPLLPNPDVYDMEETLKLVLSENEVNRLMELFENALVGSQETLELIQK